VRRPETQGRRTPRSGGVADAASTIVIAGVVHHLEGIQGLGRLRRTRWSLVGLYAARWPADLVVVGRPLPGVDAVAVIAGLKDDPATRSIAVLHAPSDAGCEECRADVCLSGGWSPGQLARVSRVLVELGQARARVEAVGPTERRPAPHAERMEALGRLTGGIVHDFNNLLFVITGQIELARRQLTADHPAFARLAPALHAAERAGALNRQLLAFGRGSPADPRPVDLNAVVAQLDRMLQRVIGEGFRVEIRAGPGLGRVRADVTEMEQLLLNLALNARDAMPRGGRLMIETRDIEIAGGVDPPAPPGRYVMVAVCDEGVGMDDETRKRIFEPFFTTKPEGMGSGLGLATVHRIVERHGGRIRVDSVPGRGTTFQVYLPCLDESAEAP
jgi:signal transduction histidine kinase